MERKITMKNKIGSLCILLGVLCMGAAVFLFVQNHQEEKEAGIHSEAALEQMIRVMSEKNIESSRNEKPNSILTDESTTMKELLIDENAYIGYISIPVLNIELPVLAEWNYELLKLAPCRYQGTVYEDNMILMAHNYETHFGRIDELRTGDPIYFINVEGKIYEYEVIDRDLLASSAVEEILAEEYDLALFTCTYGGKERITIYCEKQ